MSIPPEPREISRRLVAGSWGAVDAANYRATYLTAEEPVRYVCTRKSLVGTAWEYVSDTQQDGFLDFRADRELFAVVEFVFSTGPRTRRRPLADLSPATRHRYLASRAAKAEARAHGMSVEEWYQVAPDLRAFRGHARGRRAGGPVFPRDANYMLYVIRDYRNVDGKPRRTRYRRSERAKARKEEGRV